MEIVPIDQIIETLASDPVKRKVPEFYSSGKSKTLGQLSHKLKDATDEDIRSYLAGLILYKLNSPDLNLQDPENINYIVTIEEVISKSEILRPQYYFHMDTILRKLIHEVKNIPHLFEFAKIAKNVAKYEDLQEGFISIENQAVLLYFDVLIKISENQLEEDGIKSIKYLKEFKKLGYNICSLAEMLGNAVASFIEERNNLYYETEYGLKANVQDDFKVIDYLFRSGIPEGECMEKLRKCDEVLSRKVKRDYRKKDIIKDFTMSAVSLFADLNKIQKIGKEEFIYSIPGVDCFVSIGTYENENLIIKEYRMDANTGDEIRKRIEQEANCYEFLAEKDNGIHDGQKRFLKYKGLFDDRDRNITTLIYENWGQTLLDYRKEMHQKKIGRPSMSLIRDLLNIFSELEAFSIFHQNINLLTIFIDKSQHIKVGDFYGALINETEAIVDPTGRKFRDDYYWPEMVEECKQKVGKQDVFALGLVILHLARPGESNLSRIGNTYEEIKSNLMQMIENVRHGEEGEWLANLLNIMLNFDHSQRRRFKTLTEHVNKAIASTASNFSIKSNISN